MLGGGLPDIFGKDPLKGVDIGELIDEYKLIQQKKSKLSRRLRDAVEQKINLLLKQGEIDENELK